MPRIQQGFSIVELMSVIAIIAILVAGGVPAYQHVIRKARYSELINAAAPYKSAVELCYQTTGELNDCDDGKQSIPAAITAGSLDGLVDSLSVTNGRITVTPQKKYGLNKQDTLELKPSIRNHHLNWQRGGGAVTAGYVS